MQDRVIEFACDLQRPERSALRDHAVDVGRRRVLRRLDRDRRDPLRPRDVDADEAVADAGVVDAALKRRQRDALAAAVAWRTGREFLRPLAYPGLQLAGGRNLVDQ